MSKKKLKITFIHPDLGIGGAERLILDVAIACANDGHQVSFLTNHCNKQHAFAEIQNDNFPVEVIGDWLPRSILGKCQAFCAYIRMIYLVLIYILFVNDGTADIYFVDQIPVAIPFLRWTNKRVVYYCHHPDLLASPPGGHLKRLYRLPIDWTEYKCTSLADTLLVNSEYTASVFKSTFPDIQTSIRILYPTIASSYQEMVVQIKHPKAIGDLVPEITSSKASDVVFLSVNRFHPAKGLELAINAFADLNQIISASEWERIYLVVAGGFDPQSKVNATYFEELVALANSRHLENKVIFLKSPADQLKADLLSSCDCLLYTPVNEHFGIVPLEAMACGKPVIACDSGGPRETVKHGVTGYLCDSTAASLADYMTKVLNKDHAKLMGEKGKARLKNKFCYDKFVEGVRNIVNE